MNNEHITQAHTRTERQGHFIAALARAVREGKSLHVPAVATVVTHKTDGTVFGISYDRSGANPPFTFTKFTVKQARELANTLVEQAREVCLDGKGNTMRCVVDGIASVNDTNSTQQASKMKRTTVADILTLAVGGKGNTPGKNIGVRALSQPWKRRKQHDSFLTQQADIAAGESGKAFYATGVLTPVPKVDGNGNKTNPTHGKRTPFEHEFDAAKAALRNRDGPNWWHPVTRSENPDFPFKGQERKNYIIALAKDAGLLHTTPGRAVKLEAKEKAAPAKDAIDNTPIATVRKVLKRDYGLTTDMLKHLTVDMTRALLRSQMERIVKQRKGVEFTDEQFKAWLKGTLMDDNTDE